MKAKKNSGFFLPFVAKYPTEGSVMKTRAYRVATLQLEINLT